MFNFTPEDLRRNATVHEQILWNYLRARRMLGLKFRRQHPIGPFIVDFICLSKKIIIEVDGPVHDSQTAYDQDRDRWLRSQGFLVLRVKNVELDENEVQVMARIRKYLMGLMGFKK